MANYFNSINIGLRGLQAQKGSLDVTGHNITNANTEGYSRQRAIHTATDPYTVPGLTMPVGAGQVGTGVKIAEITRLRDEFIDGEFRQESQAQGYWSKRFQGLNRIELILNEPSDSSLNSSLDNFWKSLQDLSNHPEDTAYRVTVREQALSLIDNFHTLNNQLVDYQQSLNQDVGMIVTDVNSMAKRIADLNKQIVSIKGSGQRPNDLLDKRDLLFDELNQKLNVQGRLDSRGNLNISVGGVALVFGDSVNKLAIEESPDPMKKYHDQVIFANTGEKANIDSGELRGILDTRDFELASYLGKLDLMAEKFVTNFNKVHQQGYDLNGNEGLDFFTINSNGIERPARMIDLSKDIKDDLTKIAAGNYSDNPKVVKVEISDSAKADPEANYQFKLSKKKDDELTYTIYDQDGYILKDSNGNDLTGSIAKGDTIDLTNDYGIKFIAYESGEANLSLKGSPGSGVNAIALADVLNKDQIIDDSPLTNYYEGLISSLGVDGQRSKQMVHNQDILVGQLDNQRNGISGVFLDEEVANMIKYMQAYNAAAKIITTTDRILDSLMGIIR